MTNEERTRIEIRSNWANTGLLMSADTPQREIELASMLDGQRIANESSDNPQWNRVSVPLMVRLFKNNKNFKGSHLPLPLDHTFQTEWHDPTVRGCMCNLDVEAEELAQVFDKIIKEINELAFPVYDKTVTIHSLQRESDGRISMNYNLE